jgi:zeaxanthin glucosyltransferase
MVQDGSCLVSPSPVADRGRVLFVVSGYSGHLNPALAAGRRLSAAGFQVCYALPPRAAWVLAARGLPVHPLAFLPEPRASGTRSAALGDQALDRFVADVDRVLGDLVERFRPELVLLDPFCVSYHPFFWKAGRRCAVLSTKVPLDFAWAVPPCSSNLVPRRGLWSGLACLAAWLRCWQLWTVARARRRLGEILGGGSWRTLERAVAERCHYAYRRHRRTRPFPFGRHDRTVPELHLYAEELDFPANRKGRTYLGPGIDAERMHEPFEPPPGLAGRRLVYLCFGSVAEFGSGDQSFEFLDRVLEMMDCRPDWYLIAALASEPLHAHAAAGAARNAHGNATLLRRAPQLALLRSAAVMIGHAGTQSINEALFMGVPQLTFPLSADQAGNAARLVYHGLGARAEPSDSTAELERKLAFLMDDPGVARRVQAMRAHLLRYRSRQPEVEAVERLVRESRSGLTGRPDGRPASR